MHYLFLPHNHLVPIRRWAKAAGAGLSIDGATFELAVTRGDRTLRLTPRFSVRLPQGLAYTHHMPDEGSFVGWAPYHTKRWDLSSDKLAFKRRFAERGLCVPELLTPDTARGRDYLIKSRSGSFGAQVRGPLRAGLHDLRATPLSEHEICEEYIFGRAAKAWFWNGVSVAMEIVEPPHLCGDGQRTVAQLLASPRGSMDRPYPAEEAAAMLAWQGLTVDTMPAAGQRVWLGFKYVTAYDRVTFIDRDALQKSGDCLRAQVARAGHVAFDGIPADIRRSTMFTLDAVIDADDRAWWLEMNAHPMVHPQLYPAMLDDLFAN